MKDLFLKAFDQKRVLVTGHTGFKGSWLALWLTQLGAQVTGYSKYIPSTPSHFESINLENHVHHIVGDVRDVDHLQKIFSEVQPEIVFHLAAQPIVRESYQEPKLTFDTNLGGTVNILECIKNFSSVQSAVMITSDKCYENVGWDQGYIESDRLGGADPYSASKACAEIAFSSYARSFFSKDDMPRIATSRAGNVIGGGDWAKDRIVPDCIRAWSQKETPIIRKPDATRPWQHVLEPLSGYLWLAALLMNQSKNIHGESFNFGPKPDDVQSVGQLADLFLKYWGSGEWKHVPAEGNMKEAKLLQLSCEKALKKLSWKPVLSFDETIQMTAQWYQNFYRDENLSIEKFSIEQIEQYVAKAKSHAALWATEVIHA